MRGPGNYSEKVSIYPKWMTAITILIAITILSIKSASKVRTRDQLGFARHFKCIISSAPMKLASFDFLHLGTCEGGFQYLLVITDHFTRYTQVYPTCNKEAKAAADQLFNDYILRFEMPGKSIHDQDQEFESRFFQLQPKLFNIKKRRNTSYHPQWNGQVERMNQPIISMLKALESTEKKTWKNHINKLVHTYNYIKDASTGHAPYFCLDENHSYPLT